MTRYAARTAVPANRSKAEIERLLERFGADRFMHGWDLERAFVGFRCQDRMVKFVLPMPDSSAMSSSKYDQEVRRRWRSLALVIKAKLEAVATGITTFESEFLAHIVMPDGQTVAEHTTPWIRGAYAGDAVRLLPEFSGQ